MNSLLLITVVGLAAPALKEKPLPVVGEWIAEIVTIGGEVTYPSQGASPLIHVFTNNGEWIIRRGDKRLKETPGWFRVDQTKKPFEIDLGAEKAKPELLVLKGIFKVEGNKLTLCYSPPSVDRQTVFESPKSSQVVLWVFSRKKPGDK